jgi:predicted signal transduction protein with EAL and GGDEF domain
MIVLAARDETIALIPQIRAKVAFAVVLALCLSSLLTIRRIHRRLEPLERLFERSQAADADPVGRSASPGDEVDTLERSYDSMTEQLKLQLRCLSATIEISRLVVSAFGTRGIVMELLRRVRDLYPCDAVGVVLMKPDPPHGLQVFVGDARQPEPIDLDAFTPEEVHQLYNDPQPLTIALEGDFPHYLEPVADAGARMALVVPLLVTHDLTGLIALGHRDPAAQQADRGIFVHQLADQTATALFNARLAEENRNLAYYDALTGLPNRRLYMDRLEQALIFARRRSRRVATCLLDLDGFNRVNESLGAGGGDRILREVAERLQKRLRVTDAVARASFADSELEADSESVISRDGGDDFTFLLTEISHPQDAALVARRVLDAISSPFDVEGAEIYASASIGIAVFPDDGDDVRSLLLNAGTALSCAKARGRDHFQFFARSMNMEASRKLHLESRLQNAIERGETFLEFQPIQNARTGQLCSAEALVRWEDPEMGRVSPEEFIPVAEETHTMVPLGLWVIRQACMQAKAWREEGFEPFRLSINLSVRQLRDRGLAEAVAEILREADLSPANVEFEITESAILGDDDATLSTLQALRDLGTGLALDDFGTGYSSLSYLRRLEIDRLKIDRAFVMDLPASEEDANLTGAIISMAHSLGIPVVAEGVETLEQAELLREQGCDDIQGYLIGRPMPPDEFSRFLERDKRGDAE